MSPALIGMCVPVSIPGYLYLNFVSSVLTSEWQGLHLPSSSKLFPLPFLKPDLRWVSCGLIYWSGLLNIPLILLFFHLSLSRTNNLACYFSATLAWLCGLNTFRPAITRLPGNSIVSPYISLNLYCLNPKSWSPFDSFCPHLDSLTSVKNSEGKQVHKQVNDWMQIFSSTCRDSLEQHKPTPSTML